MSIKIKDPYRDGYGYRWPSSPIVSHLNRSLDLYPIEKPALGIDFGCGLGPHGWLLEELGFTKVYYLDNSKFALTCAQEERSRFPSSTNREFIRDLSEIKEEEGGVNLIIDRASLQHNTIDFLIGEKGCVRKNKKEKSGSEGVLSQIANLIKVPRIAQIEFHSAEDSMYLRGEKKQPAKSAKLGETVPKRKKDGLLITEWVREGPRDFLTSRFPHLTLWKEIEDYFLTIFHIVDITELSLKGRDIAVESVVVTAQPKATD